MMNCIYSRLRISVNACRRDVRTHKNAFTNKLRVRASNKQIDIRFDRAQPRATRSLRLDAFERERNHLKTHLRVYWREVAFECVSICNVDAFDHGFLMRRVRKINLTQISREERLSTARLLREGRNWGPFVQWPLIFSTQTFSARHTSLNVQYPYALSEMEF